MTGPEHYAEAERLLVLPAQQLESGDPDSLTQLAVMAEAQVHATLALAAATGLQRRDGDSYLNEWSAWDRVAGVAS